MTRQIKIKNDVYNVQGSDSNEFILAGKSTISLIDLEYLGVVYKPWNLAAELGAAIRTLSKASYEEGYSDLDEGLSEEKYAAIAQRVVEATTLVEELLAKVERRLP